MAISIAIKCIYNEIYNNKSILKDFVWYIIAILIHPVAMLIFIFRLGYEIFTNKTSSKRYIKILLIILVLTSIYLFKNRYVMIINKYINYKKNNDYFLIYDFTKFLLSNISIIYIAQLANKYTLDNDVENQKVKKMSKFVVYLIILISVLGEYNIFVRISYFVCVLAIPLLTHIFNDKFKGKISKTFELYIFLLIVFLLGISCTRGHLSSFKFLLLTS